MNLKDFLQIFFMFWSWLKKIIWKPIWCWALSKSKEECEKK